MSSEAQKSSQQEAPSVGMDTNFKEPLVSPGGGQEYGSGDSVLKSKETEDFHWIRWPRRERVHLHLTTRELEFRRHNDKSGKIVVHLRGAASQGILGQVVGMFWSYSMSSACRKLNMPK